LSKTVKLFLHIDLQIAIFNFFLQEEDTAFETIRR